MTHIDYHDQLHVGRLIYTISATTEDCDRAEPRLRLRLLGADSDGAVVAEGDFVLPVIALLRTGKLVNQILTGLAHLVHGRAGDVPTKACESDETTSHQPEPTGASDRPLEGEEIVGEARDAITVRIPQSLKARIDGLLVHASLHGEPEEIESMTDLVRIASSRLVSDYERTHHRGEPFSVSVRGRHR